MVGAERNWIMIFLLAVTTWLAGGLAVDAMAQGIFSVEASFTCVGGYPSSSLLQLGTGCPSGPEDGKVFSFFICQFESILSEVLGRVYCSVVWEATPAIKAALTLLIALTGVSFLMGLTPFTAKELAVLGVKFSLVLAFATQAEYMIGYGYALFVGLAKEGIVVVLEFLFTSGTVSGAPVGGFSSGDDVYRVFDTALEDLMSSATQNEGENAANPCQNSVFAMMVILAAAVPPMAFMGMYFLFRLLWMVLRAVFGYCQGLLGLTFLTILAPIYVSFALFKPTRTLFDKWVKYLISFGFQMVIVFAFIGMLFYMLDKISDDFGSYMDLVQPNDQVIESGPGIFNPISGCGICELEPIQTGQPPKCKSGGGVIPITEMSKNEEFMEFVTVKALAMIILFYVLDIMIGFVPEIARHLSGPKYAGQLGGGGSHLQFPGEKAIGNSLGAGARSFMGSSNSASGLVNGMVAAGSHALTGERGVVDTAIRSLANPLDPHRSVGEMDNSPAGNLFGAAAGVTGAAAAFNHFAPGSSPSTPSGPGPTPPSSSPTISAGAGDDSATGSASGDTLTGGSGDVQLDRALDKQAGEVEANVGTMSGLRHALLALKDPTSESIGQVLGSMPVSQEELRAIVLQMDKNELDPRVIEYLNSYSA